MRSYFKSLILSLPLLLLSLTGFAQDAAAPATTGNESSFNPIMIGLASVIVVLLFAIAVLGGVMRQLAIVYRDKMRAERSGKIMKTLLLLVALSLPALSGFAQEAAPAAAAPSVITGVPSSDFYALISIVGFELLIVLAMIIYMGVLLRAISAKTGEEAGTSPAKRVSFWDKFNDVVPIEKEQDIMLDHDYDGIHELDNSLPPWWKYGFYLTIVVGVIYLWYYHGGGHGPSSAEEYIAAVKKGEEDKAAYLAKTAGNIDENNVTMSDAAGLEEGKTLFSKNCAACHLADGGGLVGPNLTDDYWIHGGSLQDVFKSIKYGWQDKGMKSWKDDFSPKQIAELASFVRTLHGTKPASPKEKQGELYVEGETAAPATDSTNAKPAKNIAVE